MNMKKIISWGMMLAAAFTLTNCAKEVENPNDQPQSAGYPFEIVASTVDTKTVNDGMHTNWAEGDKINLFHAVCDGADYKNNGAFTVSDIEGGNFTGNVCEALDVEEEYDWYAVYPYNADLTSPKNTTAAFTIATGLVQDGYGDMKHLAGDVLPLYGKAAAVPGADMPSIAMSHIASVIAVNVTNNTSDAIEVNEVSFVADGNYLAGSYYFDFSGDKLTFKPAKPEYTATVSVNNATSLAAGASATVYLAIMPFEAYEGDCLTLTINDEVTKEIYLEKDVYFTSGRIKTLNFSYETEEEPAGPETLTVAEFLELKDTATEYVLTGQITRVANTSYGNFDLTDETGTVYVYGLLTPEGTSQKQWAAAGLKLGDVITVKGKYSVYNNSPQIKNAYYVSHTPIALEPSIECADNVITITSTEAGAVIYYTIDGSDPTTSSSVYSVPVELNEGDEYIIKAIAVVEGKLTSPVASRLCKWVDPNASVGTPSNVACYTLSTASQKGSNNSYAGNCDITVNGIKWNVNGNTQINPWRIGGKSITKTDRTVYSKTSYADALSKVEFVSGSVNATWNSLTLIYSTSPDFKDAKTITASGIGQNKTIAFTPEEGFPAGCYFKFVLNVTVSGSSNKYVQLKEIKFYGYE